MTESKRKKPVLPLQPAGPLLIVLSGPSGVGKDAVLSRLRKSGRLFKYITTATTRPKRPGERDKVNYHFVSPDRFEEMIEEGELLEWANVYGNWYGVPKKSVRDALTQGKDVIVKVDIQGAATIKKSLPQAILIFLTPPSMKDLTVRLEQRQTESPGDLARRIKTAEEEVKHMSLFDYIVVNQEGKIEQTVNEILNIIAAEKRRLKPRKVILR